MRKAMWMVVVAVMVAGCSSGPPLADDRAATDSVPVAEAEAAYDDDRVRTERAGPVATAGTDDVVAARAEQEGEPPAEAAEPPGPEGQERSMPLLIYTGSVVLAIYKVDETQEAIIDAVDEMGGYVAERSSNRLTARVPAEKFRDAMDILAEKGDVLDTDWKAQDVTEKVRDVQIRIRNARQLRERLEQLLEETETIAEALEIESELERVTLEIERLEGQLASLEDRIAFSTIQVSFRTIEVEEAPDVPDEEFMLPFALFDDLGLESLMREPRRYR